MKQVFHAKIIALGKNCPELHLFRVGRRWVGHYLMALGQLVSFLNCL